MKSFLSRSAVSLRSFVILVMACLVQDSQGQTNSWTGSMSGNWHDATWSLGALPGTNQTVMLTNAGWKAVQINASTAQGFPQSMNVNSIVIASPTNSFNTLLLNFSGMQVPLAVKTLSVSSNSAMSLLSSALQINGPSEGGMTVGGQFDQNDSTVEGNQINVGYIGPGIYSLNSGFLGVNYLWVGGPFNGTFHQNGGTNATSTTHLDGGEYVLNDGSFAGQIYFNNGTFRQQGGILQTNVYIFQGNYVHSGGILEGDIIVPGTDGFSSGAGTVLQTGGTNYGSIYVGSYGLGYYTLSNGVSAGVNLTVDYNGNFIQWGGMQTNSALNIVERQVDPYTYMFGQCFLNGGLLAAPYETVDGHYTQTGGTNLVDTIATGGTHGAISQSGGRLDAQTIELSPSFVGGAFLTGGTMVASDQLLLEGNGLPQWQGFVMSGGELIVSNIFFSPQGSFTCNGGTISQSGIVDMPGGAILRANASMQSFGPLALEYEGDTNSFLYMGPGAGVVRFADSSSLSWKFPKGLIVENWSGALGGGGHQQIVFGNNGGGLTEEQLGFIQFDNPAGLSPGMYAARILCTGEIVPAMGALGLRSQTNGMQLVLRGQVGGNYIIEASTDLVHWTPLANAINTNGTLQFSDTNAPNFPMRFYRARLIP